MFKNRRESLRIARFRIWQFSVQRRRIVPRYFLSLYLRQLRSITQTISPFSIYLLVDIIVAIQHETALTQQAVAELHEPDYQNTTEILTTNENNAGDATDDQETADEIVFINKSHWQF